MAPPRGGVHPWIVTLNGPPLTRLDSNRENIPKKRVFALFVKVRPAPWPELWWNYSGIMRPKSEYRWRNTSRHCEHQSGRVRNYGGIMVELCVQKTNIGGEARKKGCHNSAAPFGWEPNGKWNYDPQKWTKSPKLRAVKHRNYTKWDRELKFSEPGYYTIHAQKPPTPIKF